MTTLELTGKMKVIPIDQKMNDAMEEDLSYINLRIDALISYLKDVRSGNLKYEMLKSNFRDLVYAKTMMNGVAEDIDEFLDAWGGAKHD